MDAIKYNSPNQNGWMNGDLNSPHKNNSPNGWMKGELNSRHKNNSFQFSFNFVYPWYPFKHIVSDLPKGGRVNNMY